MTNETLAEHEIITLNSPLPIYAIDGTQWPDKQSCYEHNQLIYQLEDMLLNICDNGDFAFNMLSDELLNVYVDCDKRIDILLNDDILYQELISVNNALKNRYSF